MLTALIRWIRSGVDVICFVCGGQVIQVNGKAVCSVCHRLQGTCCD